MGVPHAEGENITKSKAKIYAKRTNWMSINGDWYLIYSLSYI